LKENARPIVTLLHLFYPSFSGIRRKAQSLSEMSTNYPHFSSPSVAKVAEGGGPSGSAASTTAPPSTKNNHGVHHHEDYLLRSWRNRGNHLVNVISKSEKGDLKEIDDATIEFLKKHRDWSATLSYLEAKLIGKAAELEILQHHVRCMPSAKRKKRKIEEVTASGNT
jgi:hypothetical protein